MNSSLIPLTVILFTAKKDLSPQKMRLELDLYVQIASILGNHIAGAQAELKLEASKIRVVCTGTHFAAGGVQISARYTYTAY